MTIIFFILKLWTKLYFDPITRGSRAKIFAIVAQW